MALSNLSRNYTLCIFMNTKHHFSSNAVIDFLRTNFALSDHPTLFYPT